MTASNRKAVAEPVQQLSVPFFRPAIGEAEIEAVVATLRSGWLTTGTRSQAFEAAFANYVGANHAVAVNSCTAALHLALEALGIQRGDLVLVPTLTFAATAEVVRYFDAIPVLVDSEPIDLCMDPESARRTLIALRNGEPTAGLQPPYGRVKAIIPVHYGGQMADVGAFEALAAEFGLSLVLDAAHSLPAFYRASAADPWRNVGTCGNVVCFSFYANKCITTGEGGMAVTNDPACAERMRTMSLHGLSRSAWTRFAAGGSHRYEIIAPGFKYNLTDIAAAIGLEQLKRADELLEERAAIARAYTEGLARVPHLQLPRKHPDRRHAWHLYAVRFEAGAWARGRDGLIQELARRGVSCSVHWMPLHLHPYYREKYGYETGLFPVAEAAYAELVSLPIFPGLTEAELSHVIESITQLERLAG